MCYKCGGSGYTKKGKLALGKCNKNLGKACKICYYRQHGGSCPMCMGNRIIKGKSKWLLII